MRDPSTCREAFNDLIRLYTEPLYRLIRRTVQDHDDANDILQNTFLKAWQNIENFRGDAKLSTWLYKIAINESMTYLEKERRRRGLSLDDEESQLVSLIQADTNVDGDELAKKLRLAVASLPEKQRLVFNMRYYDDMKYEQMSDIMGTSVGALKASYHLAVKKIEQFFEEND
ncbi:MAG: sigma-70 family RNA polymerase sigma factor [Muribaculum sp.]|nr:sigma-70 family RNA polymerase sigma factor [Muribaculum sp.]